MKLLFTLLSIVLVFIGNSCSSEYSERLSVAKELRSEIDRTLENKENLGEVAFEQVNDLQEKISFHAKVSGNEELFIKQLEEK
jgi:hypothetical protein